MLIFLGNHVKWLRMIQWRNPMQESFSTNLGPNAEGVFVLAALGFTHVQKQFFPLSERPELFFQLRMPEGSAIGASMEAAKQAEALLKGDGDAAYYASYIGRGPPRFWLGMNPAPPDEFIRKS